MNTKGGAKGDGAREGVANLSEVEWHWPRCGHLWSTSRMRTQDLERLKQPYSSEAFSPKGRKLAKALNVHVSNSDKLYDAIYNDLDPRIGGVGWWSPYPSDARRRLISDYLLQAVWSVQYNLIEAGLHSLELVDWTERESVEMRHSPQIDERGHVTVKYPPSRCPADDISNPMVDLHTAGTLRALASALDCMGAGIIGVLALPTSILRSDWKTARRALLELKEDGSVGPRMQLDFMTRLEAIVASAGPSGWIDWVLEYRHMFAHRARRLQPNMISVKSSIFDASGKPVVRGEMVRLLPRDPGLCEVDAWREPTRAPVLTEASEVTISGVVQSAVASIDAVANSLLEIWDRRRNNPTLVVQPDVQWANTTVGKRSAFEGYAPGSTKYDPQAITSNPDLVRRLSAASLLDGQRQQWQAFA